MRMLCMTLMQVCKATISLRIAAAILSIELISAVPTANGWTTWIWTMTRLQNGAAEAGVTVDIIEAETVALVAEVLEPTVAE